jgi:MscS family membrane protein
MNLHHLWNGGNVSAGFLVSILAPMGFLDSLSETWQTVQDTLSAYWTNLSSTNQAVLCFATIILGGLVAAFISRWVWKHVLMAVARRTKTTLDETILTAARGPIQILLVVGAIYVAANYIETDLPNLAARQSWRILHGVLYVALVLSSLLMVYAALKSMIAWYGSKLSNETGSRYTSYAAIFRVVTQIVLVFLALTIILDHFQVQITGLLATAGIASLAVALAAQETLANTIAGFALMVDRPFRAGDRVELPNNVRGDVIEVGLRSTRIMTFDNTVVAIPNSEMAKSHIVNLNAPDAHVKIRCTLGVAYGTDLRKAKAVLIAIMTEHADVQKDPAPAVFFTEFGESALNLLFECWVADYREKFRIQDELNMAIKDRFEAEGINIPFPQRDVHIIGGEGPQASGRSDRQGTSLLRTQGDRPPGHSD